MHVARRPLPFLLLTMALTMAFSGAALAGERIHFKNGHSFIVRGSYVEGDMVFLTLPDGSTIGFPKDLIAEVEEDKDVVRREAGRGGGRGKTYRELEGYRRWAVATGQATRLIGQGSLSSGGSGQKVTIGYSRYGSGWGGTPQRASKGARGISVFDRTSNSATSHAAGGIGTDIPKANRTNTGANGDIQNIQLRRPMVFDPDDERKQ